MRVLMLGWEFPPHISGGLGTACAGLVQGLAAQGVDVLFAVPRAHGDEDQTHARVVGANTVVLEEVVRRRVARAGLVSAPAARPAAEADLAWLASAHSAYATAGEYARRVAATGAVLSGEPLAAAHGAARALQVGRERFEEVVEHVVRRPPLEFQGGYGPDLWSEIGRFALAAGQIAARETFDVVHAHDWMTVPAGLAARRVSGKPLVLHVHACEHDRSGEHPDERVRAVEQMGLDAADRVVPVSHYTAATLERHYRLDRAKVRVVHNAVTHREQAQRLRVQKTIDEPVVLFLGRVTFQKGPEAFLEAAALVVRRLPRVRFVMSGSGDLLPSVVERAARLGLARHVHFTGFLRGVEVERMYALADVYVMPSVSEPFGISPLEAMALDVPVIVSRQSGVSEVLRHALKFDHWDVQALADKIVAVLSRPALARFLVERGRDEVARLSWETAGARLLETYRELAA